MKSLVQYIIENIEYSQNSINEASFTKDEGNNFEARIIDKHNYNKRSLTKLTDKILSILDVKNNAKIRWVVDTDKIDGTIHKSELNKLPDKTTWAYSSMYEEKRTDEMYDTLKEFSDWFPNSTTIMFKILK